MTEAGGYVRLYRKLLENPVWTALAPSVLKVMLACLIKANWEPTSWYAGQGEATIPRGSFITSYARMAELCHLSIKQIRGSFEHLQRIGFASFSRAYTRAEVRAQEEAPRGAYPCTLVTVLKYEVYQASVDDEGTAEGKPLGTRKDAQGGNNRRNKKKEQYTPYPLKGVCDLPTDLDDLPLDPLPSEVNGEHHSAAKTANGRSRNTSDTVHRLAERIHSRHPKVRRDIGVAQVERKLTAILRHQLVPVHEREAYLERIDRNHAALCASEAWQKDSGQFAKGLENWLAPTNERYLCGPPPSTVGPDEPPRMLL
jgi:hypothetical protein